MWQDMDQRGRLIAAGVLIVLGALLLLNNLFRVELTAWAWIIALGAAAAAFAWVYAQDRTDWAGIAAYVFGAIAVLIFLATQISAGGVILPVYVMLAIAAPFVVGWWFNRQNWGLLIPAYVMVAIVGVLLLGEGTSDLVAPYVMGAIGLPFMVAFVVTRQWPLLIPGGIMWLIGAFLLAGATETSGQVVSIVIAVGLIAAGGLMLWRGTGGPVKPKNE